jgi:hypothetical protein
MIKTIQNVQTVLNFSKKTNLNFVETRFQPRSQSLPKDLISNVVKRDGWKLKLRFTLIIIKK